MSDCVNKFDEPPITDILSALKAHGYTVIRREALAKSATARARDSYRLFCEDGNELLLIVSVGGVPNFYLQRSLRFIEQFSKQFFEYLYSEPICQGKVRGSYYVVYEYLRGATFANDDFPVRALEALYERCAVSADVNEEVIQDVLENFLSAWPAEYRHAISRLEEFVEYELLLKREKTLTLAVEHGDYTTNNILRTERGYFLIDFEFARRGQPVFFDAYDYLRSINKRKDTLNGIPNAALHECKYRLIERANRLTDEQDKNVTIFTGFDHPILAGQWDTLYLKQGASYNLSRAWCRVWAKNFLPKGGCLEIFTVWNEDRLAMLLPLYRQGSLLRPIGVQPDLYDGFSALYEDIGLCSHFVSYLKVNRLSFVGKYLDSKDEFIAQLFSLCNRLGMNFESEVIDTRPLVNLNQFSLAPKEKADIKRLKNRIHKRFDTYPTIDVSVDKNERELTKFIEMHIRRWNGGPFEQNSQLPKFLFDIARNDITVLSSLKVQDRVVAYHIGYKNGDGSITSWIPTYDSGLSDCSPGKVLVYELLASLKSLGHKAFDFGRGAESYKYWFNTGDSVLVNVTVFPPSFILGRLGMIMRRLFKKLYLITWTR